jgi:hypothetical protein
MRTLNADRLMSFIKDEAAERLSAQKPTDGPIQDAEDIGFLEGLEVVAAYVLRVTEKAA